MRQKLRAWFYEDVRKAQSGRHAPQMPKFVPSLVLLLVLTVIGLWLVFASFARLTVGSSVSYWWPDPKSVPEDQLFDIVRSTVTAAGVFAGLFAIVYAYRKQRVEEAGGRRADDEGLSQRYQDAATQLGATQAAIRLAGVYSMARLADDWPQQRQVCVDVLCAYVRMPWDLTDREEEQVRRTITAVLRSHLQSKARPTWSGMNFDFTLAQLKDFDLDGASFDRKPVFASAQFHGSCTLNSITFADGANLSHIVVADQLRVEGATLLSGELAFYRASLEGGRLSVGNVRLRGYSTLELSALVLADGVFNLSVQPDAESSGWMQVSHVNVDQNSSASIWIDMHEGSLVQVPLMRAAGWQIDGPVEIDERLISGGSMQWSPGRVSNPALVDITDRWAQGDAEAEAALNHPTSIGRPMPPPSKSGEQRQDDSSTTTESPPAGQ